MRDKMNMWLTKAIKNSINLDVPERARLEDEQCCVWVHEVVDAVWKLASDKQRKYRCALQRGIVQQTKKIGQRGSSQDFFSRFSWHFQTSIFHGHVHWPTNTYQY